MGKKTPKSVRLLRTVKKGTGVILRFGSVKKSFAFLNVPVSVVVMMDAAELAHLTVRLDISVTRSPASVTPAGALPMLIAFRTGAVKIVFA